MLRAGADTHRKTLLLCNRSFKGSMFICSDLALFHLEAEATTFTLPQLVLNTNSKQTQK